MNLQENVSYEEVKIPRIPADAWYKLKRTAHRLSQRRLAKESKSILYEMLVSMTEESRYLAGLYYYS